MFYPYITRRCAFLVLWAPLPWTRILQPRQCPFSHFASVLSADPQKSWQHPLALDWGRVFPIFDMYHMNSYDISWRSSMHSYCFGIWFLEDDSCIWRFGFNSDFRTVTNSPPHRASRPALRGHSWTFHWQRTSCGKRHLNFFQGGEGQYHIEAPLQYVKLHKFRLFHQQGIRGYACSR